LTSGSAVSGSFTYNVQARSLRIGIAKIYANLQSRSSAGAETARVTISDTGNDRSANANRRNSVHRAP